MRKRKKQSVVEEPAALPEAAIGIGNNNPPEVVVGLSSDDAKFVLAMINDNIGLLLSVLTGIKDRAKAERMIDLLEKNKRVREALKKAGVKLDDNFN